MEVTNEQRALVNKAHSIEKRKIRRYEGLGTIGGSYYLERIPGNQKALKKVMLTPLEHYILSDFAPRPKPVKYKITTDEYGRRNTEKII